MPPIALRFTSIFSVVISSARQETTDDVTGPIHNHRSVTRVSQDGSEAEFDLPHQTSPSVIVSMRMA